MEETINSTVEQDSSVETDITSIESDNQQVESSDTITGTGETTEETHAIPEKIKLGEKEYTPEQLQEYATKAEAQQAEQTANQYQPRELAVIEADIQKIQANYEADASLFKKNALLKAETPYQIVVDELGNETKEYANFTPEQAFEHGMKSGDWSYLHACFDSNSAIQFEQERAKLIEDYKPKFYNLAQEKEYIQAIESKKADISKWDAYIEQNVKDKPAEKYILDKIKNNFGFDEEGTRKFLQWFREARALEDNLASLDNDNDSAKQKMMNSTITGGNKTQGGQKIFTWAEVDRMSTKEYEKYAQIIDEQHKKGLIK